MRNLEKLVDDYLSKSTDFAIQIVGNWGFGKTYYYRNVLENSIYNKPTYNNASKNYKPIYISLFGLKSVEDIATKIVFDFYQSKYFKKYYRNTILKKRLTISESVLKIGLRGFLGFHRLGNINDYLTDVKTIGNNVLDTHEIVICFDDLERKDSSLKIEDVTGYINSLVDEGIKVLIISNEDLLLKKEDAYKDLKEKIIGITVEFIPNTKNTLESIINSRYYAFPIFSSYLNDNIEDLAILTKAAQNNFRHVIYGLDSLQDCYSKIRDTILDSKHEISKILKQELKQILIFTFALSIEYKSSLLKYSDFENLKEGYVFNYNMFRSSTHNNADKSKVTLVMEKYGIQQSNLFESIFNYVTAYDEFDISLFIVEFKKLFNLENGNIKPHYQILYDLSYRNCFSLSDNDYREKTLAVIDYAKSGCYAPVDYLSIMHCAERLNNILSLDLEEVKEQLITGISISIKNIPSNQELYYSQFDMSGRNGDISELNKQLWLKGKLEMKLFQEIKLKEKVENFANLLVSNPVEFEAKYLSDEQFKSDFSNSPLFKYFTPDKFVENIKNVDNATIDFLGILLKHRYGNYERLSDELLHLNELTSLTKIYYDQLNKQENNKIRCYVINEFINILESIRDKSIVLSET